MVLAHLEYLVAVKKYGSMNKAAAALYCAQPTISNAFQTLENELGCKIVKRTPSGLEFTEVGEQMVADAQVILGMIEGWKTISKADPSELRIAYSASAERPPMMELLMEFQRLYPETKYRMIPGIQQGVEIFHPADGFICHFGFFPHTPIEIEETKLVAAKLGLRIAKILNDRFEVCFSSQNRLANKKHIFLRDIAGMEIALKGVRVVNGGIIGFPYVHHLIDMCCRCSNTMGDHNNVMLSLINNPNLISFRPATMLSTDPYVTNGLITVCPIEDCPMEVNQYVFYPDHSRLSKQERRFIDYISSHAKLFEPVSV